MKGVEGLLNALLNSTVFGVFLYAGGGTITLSNKTFRDFIGYSEEELAELYPYDIITDEYKDAVKDLVKRRLNGEVFAAEHIHHVHKTKDGFLKPTLIFAYTVSYMDRPAGMVLVIDDSKRQTTENLFLSIKAINQLITGVSDESALLDGICEILSERAGFRLAAVGEVNEKTKLFKYMYVCSNYGETLESMEDMKISVDENLPEGRGAVGEAYRTGDIVIIPDSRTDPRLEPWRQEYIKRNIFSTCAIPILKNKNVRYIVLIQAQNPDSLNKDYAPILSEIQSDLSFALTHIEQDAKIKSLQILYAALSAVNGIIIRAKDENYLFSDICNTIVEKGLFADAFIGLFDDNLNIKSTFSYAKSDYADFLKKIKFDTEQKRQGPSVTSFLHRKIVINNDTLKNLRMLPWRDELINRGYFSSAVIPIIKKNKTIGSLAFYAGKPKFFGKDTYGLLKEMVVDINFALDKIEDERWHLMISTALNFGSDFAIITDKFFNIIYANESAYKILGYSREELIGGPYSRIFEGCPGKPGFIDKFLDIAVFGGTITDFFTYRAKNSETVHSLVTMTPFKTGNEIEYYVSTGKDITHEIEAEKTMERLVYYDSITGLPNKKMLMEKIDAFISDMAYSGNKSSALAIINPLNFTFINHSFGFEAGNKIMVEIAKRIKAVIKNYDIIAKWEADKFAIFFKNLKMDEDALQIVGRIFDSIEKVYVVGDKRLSVSFNAGISFYPKDAMESWDISNKAESALFNAGTDGGNNVRFFEKEFEEYARKKVELRNELKDAISRNEFILYYQPYFDTQTASIQGAEALLRWKKPDRLVPPMEFIPFLEQSGFITEVEEWILGEIVSKIKLWKDKRLKVVPVSMNISPVSFRDPRIKNRITAAYAKAGVESRYVNFEIVERTFMEDINRSKMLLDYLKNNGFGLSIDDFGTGYSSLSYLADLPFDFLKIDISFVSRMFADKQSMYLVETIIYLSKKLNMKSVAEGVETKEQWALLKDLGCDYVQGFLFSRPLEYEKFEKLLA